MFPAANIPSQKPGDGGVALRRAQEIDAADWFQVHRVTSK